MKKKFLRVAIAASLLSTSALALSSCGGSESDSQGNEARSDCLESRLYWRFVDNANQQPRLMAEGSALGDAQSMARLSRLLDDRADLVRNFAPEFEAQLREVAVDWRKALSRSSKEARKAAAQNINASMGISTLDMPRIGLNLTARGLCFG